MLNDKIQTKRLAEIHLGFSLQIPQGDSMEIKFDQAQCNFYLNQKVVEQIQQAKNLGISLEVPAKILIYLWYCICLRHNFISARKLREPQKTTKYFFGFLINIFRVLRSKQLLNQTSLQTSSIFNSYYHAKKLTADNYQEKDCILQSVVLFHGDVMQKIQEDFLFNNPECQMIISAHYWLIEQLLGALRKRVNLLVWELSSLFPSALFVSKIDLLPEINLVYKVVVLLIAWLGLATLLFVVRDFLFIILKRSIAINYQYLNFVAWIMSCIFSAIAMIYTQEFQAVTDTILLVISVCMPLLIRPILNFIWLRLGKIIIQRFL